MSGLSATELRPFLQVVAAHWAKSPESAAWAILSDRWARLVEHAQETLDNHGSGEPAVIHRIKAAEQVCKLADTASPQEVIQTELEMKLLQDAQPHRFKSDGAFGVQLVRRVRSLADMSTGRYWDPKTKRMKAVYRDFPPASAAVLAGYLSDAFGSAGLQLASVERRAKVDHAAIERQRLADAIEALT